MPNAILKPRESFESLMRRFKRNVEKSDMIKELRERECFEKPSMKRKRKKSAAVKREYYRREQEKLPETPY